MALTVGSITEKVGTILQDTTGVRWPEGELIDWLNAAQREVVTVDPTATATIGTVVLDDTDTMQSIPSDGIQLVDIIRNSKGRTVRKIDRSTLDAAKPEWHNAKDSQVKHFIYDLENPRYFYVYPKATDTLTVLYTKEPVEAVDFTDTLSVDDRYVNAIMDFILYRAYSKDAESATNSALAESALQRFYGGLNIKITATAREA